MTSAALRERFNHPLNIFSSMHHCLFGTYRLGRRQDRRHHVRQYNFTVYYRSTLNHRNIINKLQKVIEMMRSCQLSRNEDHSDEQNIPMHDIFLQNPQGQMISLKRAPPYGHFQAMSLNLTGIRPSTPHFTTFFWASNVSSSLQQEIWKSQTR